VMSSGLTSRARSNLAVISLCQRRTHRRWQRQIGHSENEGGGEKITVDYFHVENSTWSHAAGVPMDLGKNRIGLLEGSAHLWLTDLSDLNSHLGSLGWT